MRLVCCLVLLLGGLQLACSLLVAAWNIQTFGQSKANLVNLSQTKANILNYIATIVRRYDVIVIQEVRDPAANLPVINALMTAVNNQQGPLYAFITSNQLGQGNHMERYVYLYRTTTVRVVGNPHQYLNPQTQPPTFSRPPFIVRFQNPVGGRAFDYTFIPLHSTPDATPTRRTVRELDSLHDVVDDLIRRPAWNNVNNILLLGDFNAGCTYVRRNSRTDEFTNIRLWTLTNVFRVLIGHNVATNVGAIMLCPYDRIVVTTNMNQHVVANTAQVFNFQLQLGLPVGVQDPTDVSDHYPVEVELNP